MRAGDQADNSRARRDGAFRPDFRILDDHAIGDGISKLGGGVPIKIGRRLAPFDMFAPAVDMDAEHIADTEVLQMGLDPFDRA